MKKILIISQNSLSLHANNGRTLTGIFQTWKSDFIAQLYFQDEIPESKEFLNFFRIRDIDILKKILYKKTTGGVIRAQERVTDHLQYKSKKYKAIVNFLKKFDKLKILAREFLYKNNKWQSTELDLWISKFKPDAIFLLPSIYTFTVDIALEISKKFSLPLYVYFTDDFLENDNINLGKNYKAKIMEVIKISSGRFVIGEEMARTYKERYNLDFSILINPIDISKNSIQFNNILETKELNIVYAGGLTLGRFDSLIKFSEIVNKSQESLTKKISLKICSGDIPSPEELKIFDGHNIEFLGKLTQNELTNIYKKTSFLLHVESDIENYIKQTKLSVSTKIPECLTSGSCLIAFGPAEIASMKLIYSNKIGFFINSRADIAESSNNLIDILTDHIRYQYISKKAFDYAYNNFRIEIITDNFLKVINKSVC